MNGQGKGKRMESQDANRNFKNNSNAKLIPNSQKKKKKQKKKRKKKKRKKTIYPKFPRSKKSVAHRRNQVDRDGRIGAVRTGYCMYGGHWDGGH
jgi:hypothetical protein